ncbi:MAG: purine-nucleoside phosphorylase [bacterium]|nr:purine-nucleoside phosphorylase [bacterium]
MTLPVMYSRLDYEAAAAVIRQYSALMPDVGLVLGSGLSRMADEIVSATVIPYAKIPRCPQSTVPGHEGTLVIGHLEGVPVVAQRGRTHLYEGYTPEQVTFLIRVFALLGVKTLILTNAAGGVNPAFRPGDVMLVNDHLNFVGMAGNNPLRGSFADADEPVRFISTSHAYHADLRRKAHEIAQEAGIALQEGVYVCVSGPNFESPAEIRFLRMIGGDAVGMSTVHEVLVACHAGMRVMAMSGITNQTIDQIDSTATVSHDEVLEAGGLLVPRMSAIVRGVLRSMA